MKQPPTIKPETELAKVAASALERSTAAHRDPANAGRRFIPLLLGDCALPDTLRRCKVALPGQLFYSTQQFSLN